MVGRSKAEETCVKGKEDPRAKQKRPSSMAKETCVSVKRALPVQDDGFLGQGFKV
jgi:hypothetical protein